MDTLILIASIFCFRYLLFVMNKYLNKGGNWVWGAIIVTAIIGGVIPLILLKENILENTVVNILISGFLFFLFLLLLAECQKIYRLIIKGRAYSSAFSSVVINTAPNNQADCCCLINASSISLINFCFALGINPICSICRL